MKNHWTHYLNEAGSITTKGAEIMAQRVAVENAQRTLNALKLQLDAMEHEVISIAQHDWSHGEIMDAMAQAGREA